MKLLADKNVSHRLCPCLIDAGYEAAHVDEFSMGAAQDEVILEFARSGAWTIISSDTDFGTLLAAQRASSPSVILTREVSTLPAVDLARLLVTNLPAFADDLKLVRWWR